MSNLQKITLFQSISGSSSLNIHKVNLGHGGSNTTGTTKHEVITESFVGVNSSFFFTVDTPSTTSAGVFKGDGTLVKSLWAAVPFSQGTFSAMWDGTDNDFRLMPNGNYTVKVLTHNINYQWEGVIGNTSDFFTGSTVHRSYNFINCMAITSGSAYCGLAYNEGWSTSHKFSLSTPQQKSYILPSIGNQSMFFVVTDGNIVYWASDDPYSTNGNNYFVFGTNVADDSETIFSSGTPIKLKTGRQMLSCIDIVNNSSSAITGLAVQQSGSYLFVSHSKLNQIHILNKTTGLLLNTFTITAPKGLTVDNTGNLWVISSTNTVQKYSVNSNGTIGSVLFSITGLTNPLAIAVSPDDSTVIIADNGTYHQVKAFNNSTGAPLRVLGEASNYATDPTVANDKFYFSDQILVYSIWLCYQSDGSFWVGDVGNNRALHFSSGYTYIEYIMSQPDVYSVAVDRNNPVRVFSEYMEFQIDYSKTLAPSNGSWTFIKNWRAGVSTDFSPKAGSYLFKNIHTLSNNRTYCLLKKNSVSESHLVELPPTGAIRFTGFVMSSSNHPQIYADGSIRTFVQNGLNKPCYWQSQTLLGFDGNNNPIWDSNITILASLDAPSGVDPINWFDSRPAEITSSNVIVSFDHNLPSSGKGIGYHLGGVKLNDNKFLWKTANVTNTLYKGKYPMEDFDIGNSVKVAGSDVMTADRHIFWGYHGEFWKSSQVNKWNHVYDNGLLLGQFGATGADPGVKGTFNVSHGEEAAANMAGNAFACNVAKNGGNLYLYHGDESYHSGVHRWKISGTNTIAEEQISINVAATIGVQGQYFNGNDLNNFNVKTTRTDTNINFNWGSAVPTGTTLSDPNNFSVRWYGYITPLFNEMYTFYTNVSQGVKLFIDGNKIIDKLTGTTLTEYTGSTTLVAGINYLIRMEVNGGGTAQLSWSSPSRTKQIVPSSAFSLAPSGNISGSYDIMEGLELFSILDTNLYGWSRNQPEDTVNAAYVRYWTAKTGVVKYNKFQSPDIYAVYLQTGTTGNTYTVSRDLGNLTATTSWEFSGQVNYLGTQYNDGSKFGQYIEVLDVGGKILARFYMDNHGYSTTINTVNGNNKIIATDTRNNLNNVTDISQNLKIKGTNGQISFQYAAYSLTTDGLFDTSGIWSQPKTFRLYFFHTGSSPSLGRITNLESMKLTVA